MEKLYCIYAEDLNETQTNQLRETIEQQLSQQLPLGAKLIVANFKFQVKVVNIPEGSAIEVTIPADELEELGYEEDSTLKELKEYIQETLSSDISVSVVGV